MLRRKVALSKGKLLTLIGIALVIVGITAIGLTAFVKSVSLWYIVLGIGALKFSIVFFSYIPDRYRVNVERRNVHTFRPRERRQGRLEYW